MVTLHTVHWVKYLLLIWPVASVVLTPFIARFVAASSGHSDQEYASSGEFERDPLEFPAPARIDGLAIFPRDRA
jgi:hypothetical protein